MGFSPQSIAAMKRLEGKLKFLEKTAKSFDGMSVEVYLDPNEEYPNGERVVDVAEQIEYGTVNMPPRPFRRVAEDRYNRKWKAALRRAVKRCILLGDKNLMRKKLRKIGETIKEDYQRTQLDYNVYKTGRMLNSYLVKVTG